MTREESECEGEAWRRRAGGRSISERQRGRRRSRRQESSGGSGSKQQQRQRYAGAVGGSGDIGPARLHILPMACASLLRALKHHESRGCRHQAAPRLVRRFRRHFPARPQMLLPRRRCRRRRLLRRGSAPSNDDHDETSATDESTSSSPSPLRRGRPRPNGRQG